MLDFLKSLVGGAAEAPGDRADEVRVATAALLIHASHIDGAVHPQERKRLESLLRDHFGLDAHEIARLIDEASARERDAVDLFRFTNVLNKKLDPEGRRALVRMLWEISYADGHIDAFESNLVWRVSELIGIDARERVELRRQVAAASGSEGDR